jgi:DNA-binding PadR family transcriptional regulator
MADSDLIRGNVDTVILRVLYDGDRYGYDMIKAINAKSGGSLIKQPTLYACLKRLEKQGFISSYWDASESNGGKRKYYTLTDSGREVFVTYKNEFERTRDLFGSLITDGDTILPVDSFSDVEDESYDVPKRRSRPRPKAKRAEPSEVVSESSAAVPEPVAAVDEPTTLPPAATEEIQAEPEVENNAYYDEFVQQSFFDPADATIDYGANDIYDDVEDEPSDAPVQNQERSEPPTEKKVTSAADPHELMYHIREQAYGNGGSYSAAADRSAYEYAPERIEKKPAELQPTVAQSTSPRVQQQPAAPIIAQPSAAPVLTVEAIGGESPARREYKEILGDLVERCEAAAGSRVEERAEQAAAEETVGDRIEIRKFENVVQSVEELGNRVSVRNHNDSARVYTHKYYFYSNKLMMTHYTAMCAVMFLIGLTTFLTFYVGLGMRMRYDYALYIAAGLLPIIMFITAVIIFASDPDKKKRINVNFRFSMAIRFVIMVQVAVVIYCFNLIWGMPVGFSAAYIPSLALPLAYAIFIPISEAIFMTLLKSERYAVE